jgi:hypothetical protein
MFLEIGIILILLWVLGVAFYPIGGLIHALLVLAVVAIIWHFLSGQKIS